MTLISVQNLNYQKPLAILLVFVFISNLIFASLLLPTKKAQAISVVDVVQAPLQAAWKAIQTVWEKIKIGYEAIKTALLAAQLALGISDRAMKILKEILTAALWVLLVQILNMITNDIIRWISGGGKPRFVSDWKGFLTDAASKAGGAFIDKYLGMGWLCEPFDVQIKIALLTVPLFEERVKCSLFKGDTSGRSIQENLERFYQNFSNGGWKTWIQLTEPQNNFYGAYLMAVDKMMEEEAKAKEAAKSEAESGGGFLGHKMCTQCRVLDPETGNYTKKSGLKNCDPKNNPSGYFICDKEEIQTPPTVIQYEAQKAVDSARSLLEKQIAALTPNLGTGKLASLLSVYMSAIINALVNRVIKEGLAAIGIGAPGASPVAPTGPSPFTPTPTTDALTLATFIISSAPYLIDRQKLLKENLESTDGLLLQQQQNLAVLNTIKDTQTQVLFTLRDILAANCSLPSWVASQTISSQITPTGTIETIQLTVAGIGNMTIKKTTITNEFGSTITYEIQQITPLVSSQITALEKDIASTQQMITDVNSAISANQGAIKAAEDYKTLFENTLQPPTPEEQKKLDEAKKKMDTAYDLAIKASQKSAQTQSNDIGSLTSDTTNAVITVTQQAVNLMLARGTSEYPESGTLYAQLQTVQSKLSQAQSAASCYSEGAIKF